MSPLDINAIPNPPNSPIEKILPDTVWENIEPHVRGALSENPTKDEILRAFSYYDRVLADYIQRHEDSLTYWANIHTHSGFAGGLGPGDIVPSTIYLGSGADGCDFTSNRLDSYDAIADVWTTGLTTPAVSNWWGADAASYGGKLYYYGGHRTLAGERDNMIVYDPQAGTWASGSSGPFPVYQGSGAQQSGIDAVHEDKIYIMDDTGQLMRYDPEADTYETLATCPDTERLRGGGAFIQGRFHSLSHGPNGGTQGGPLSHWRYDPSDDTWEQLADCPAGEEWPCVAMYSDRLFVQTRFGHYMYDPVSDTWSTRASAPTPVRMAPYCRANPNNPRLYLFQGASAAGGDPLDDIQDTQVYDPASDTWSLAAPFPDVTRRQHMAAYA